MSLHRRVATDALRWEDCVHHFGAHGLILPELPAHLQAVRTALFHEELPGCFSTPGWSGPIRWSERIDDWIARPIPVRASLGIHCHDGEPLVELSLVSPHLGLFIRHRWDSGTADAASSLRVQGTCRMAGHLLARVEVLVANACWPRNQRLLLIDDGLDISRWGWLDAVPGDPLPEVRVMRVSPAMYFDAMSYLDAAVDLPLDVLPGGHAFAQLTYTQPPCRYPQKPMY